MAMARTPARRRRARRGSLERPVNARLYRGSLLLLSLPLLILAFSITRPGALTAPSLPPNFDGQATTQLAAGFATQFPDRVPGGPGSLGASRGSDASACGISGPSRAGSPRTRSS